MPRFIPFLAVHRPRPTPQPRAYPALLALLLALFSALPALGAQDANQAKALEIGQRLQTRYETLHSFAADFSQETVLQLRRGRKKTGAGTLVIQKPGFMRWDYNTPEPQVLICDGKTISIYLAQAKQLIVGNARDYLQSDVTYGFFTGSGNILQDFDLLPPSDGPMVSAGQWRLRLQPKEPHPHVNEILLTADPATALVRQLIITDRFGSETTITFNNIVIDKTFPDQTFHFEPPADTEIITQ